MRTFARSDTLAAPLLAILAIVISCPLSAAAQDTIEPTPIQVELTDQAYEAFVAGDFAKAARLYRASLDIGPMNITFANYGFALFKQGQCQAAVAAYDAAEKAPRVADPTPDEVSATIKDYRSRLAQGCGTLEVVCPEGVRSFALDEEPERSCGAGAIWVSAGDHTLTSALGEDQYSARVTVEPGAQSSVTFTLVEKKGPSDPKPSDESSLGTVGLVVGGVGLISLGTALVLELALLQPGLDELEATEDPTLFAERRDALGSQQTLTQGLLIGGVVFALGGLALYLLDSDEAPEDTVGLQWRVSPGGVGLAW